MLGVTSGLELFWNRSDRTVRKPNVIWIWIQLPFKESRMKISLKQSTSDLPWNILKLSEHQLPSLKKIKNLHLNSESLSELEVLDTDVSLK